MIELTGLKFVRFNGQTFDVKSIRDAQTKWGLFRDCAKQPANRIGNGGMIVDSDGKFVARIDYAGNIFYKPEGSA